MVKVVWGEPGGMPGTDSGPIPSRWGIPWSPEAASERPVYAAAILSDRVYAPPPVGRRPVRWRRVAAFVVGCILVGLVLGWLLP